MSFRVWPPAVLRKKTVFIISTLKSSTTIDAPCGVCALASSPEQCHVQIAETCLENRPQEASDELLNTQVETGADRGAEPDVQQAAQAEDEAAVAIGIISILIVGEIASAPFLS
jgi:hypothetical protein